MGPCRRTRGHLVNLKDIGWNSDDGGHMAGVWGQSPGVSL